ncbi:hypothetical protein DL546_002221 [Coniochaeta pulveracea]|uniref:Plasma membrane channel protein n=1 Tax=Coniochaeta pulveracea TaxID=177199 RepID=A0A420YHX7_9PEZI|nr:hypothetical protein DL546_002221 [Coniochaeta pulveracea]
MAHLGDIYSRDPKQDKALSSNFGVDYVISYKVPAKEKAEAEAAFVQLIQALADTGFATEVRHGDNDSLLIFTKIASEKLLINQIYRYRLQDWLYGIRISAPDKDQAKHLQEEPVTEAERLRLTYLLITKPKNEGGAGITAKQGTWKYVETIFPLHDHTFNKNWIKEWSTKYSLDDNDLIQIRDRFGEKVAFYFAFLQSYSTFLVFPAAFGFAAWLLLGQFSWFYAIVNSLWTVAFFEYWKVKEVDLAIQWGVRGASKIQLPRPQFQYEREAQDPVTGELVKVYSPWKRLQRQLLQVPFALACVAVLGSLICSCFAIEIFISEIYNGPFKQYLTFIPTVILTALIPTLSTFLTGFAEKLTVLENYETQDSHQAAFVQKIFILNFITSYLGIFLTAFVYVPFARVLVPYLSVFQTTAQRFTASGKPLPTKQFEVDANRLTNQVIYFTVTAQIVNLVLEVVVPFVKRKVFKTVKEVQTEMSSKKPVTRYQDSEDEKEFLARVRTEASLDEYDVTIDYREMVVQFGYLSLFSVVWPLTGCSFLVNNWIEARSDALKIAIGNRRPIPWRADSIGPWLSSLAFLSWLGSITSSALVYLFHNSKRGPDGSPSSVRGWVLLLTIIFAEHLYLVVQILVRYMVAKLDRPGLQKERAERFAMRKNLLEESLGQDLTEQASGLGVTGGEKITREALEEEQRRASIHGQSHEEAFWQRQRGAAETIQIGRLLISEVGQVASNQTTIQAKQSMKA